MISVYLIVFFAFAIVATYLSVVREFLDESEREAPPSSRPTSADCTARANCNGLPHAYEP